MQSESPSHKALTRADLAAIVYEMLGTSKQDSIDIVSSLIEEISLALEQGDAVKISSFGSFLLRDKAERMGRNPKTGAEFAISPRRVVSFKPSSVLKKKLNEGGGNDE